MLSLTCKTAIKAVIYLAACHPQGKKSGMKEIAAFIDASEHTVGKILQTLVKDGVVNSSKGPSGGFFLSDSQLQQPVIRIIDAIDGSDIFEECGLGLSKCSSTHPCPLHNDYKEIRDRFREMCRNSKVSDLCHPVHKGLAYLIG